MAMRKRTFRPGTLPLALGVVLALAVAAAGAETGTVLKATELRAEPQAGADILAKLAAKDSVEITARQGAWAGVTTTAGQSGWVRILNLRTGSGETSRGGGQALASVFRTGSTSADASTGVKGLGAEDLRRANPNAGEAARLAQFAAAPDEARTHAAEAGLEARQVAYLESRKPRGRNR
ncbi:SH3 domain-containing protein [Arenimonas fontis]|uniref:SH3 domain-containing protein n=1 Tax=Arenimonas fontis TaxID=2608255 RepID=A0A5B2ZDE0_9GAMM|nr:SH3 domain-containing protein [Arenimonas fontis]KAA2286049.1 SH3 domain-containing protein [Arenimonas fontis]